MAEYSDIPGPIVTCSLAEPTVNAVVMNYPTVGAYLQYFTWPTESSITDRYTSDENYTNTENYT